MSGLNEPEQQEGDERDGDLDAHGVLRGAEEVPHLEGLLDPAEEQFDGPTSLIEIGDLLGGGVEIVAQDAQHLAGLGLDADFADWVLEGIDAAACLSCRQVADAVGQDGAALWNRQVGNDGKRRVGLEAGDDAAAGGIELGPQA